MIRSAIGLGWKNHKRCLILTSSSSIPTRFSRWRRIYSLVSAVNACISKTLSSDRNVCNIAGGNVVPSLAHRFVRKIETKGQLLRNYTQNIDGLEKMSGIERVIHCHGSFATATCR
mmetsp:Transcript_32983/g.129440  ORF Transcript_32983/g.129440 Transcript_32983/m.129440 type:complete len:116 (-) Transcript_32983:916-1263(-)